MMTVPQLMHAFGSGFGRVNPLAVVLSGIAVIGIMAWLVALEILRKNRRRREEVQIGWRYFEDYSAQRRLTPAESEMLRAVVRSGEVTSAEMVFDSPFVFEDALEAYLADEKDRLARDESPYVVLRGIRSKLGYSQLPAEIPLTSTRQLEAGLPAHWQWAGRRLQGELRNISERSWQLDLPGILPEGIAPQQMVEIGILRPGDAEYCVQTTIAALRPGHHALILNHTRNLERKQMRNWVRVEVNLPCRTTVISGPDHPGVEDGPLPAGLLVEGKLIDLSGGGTCARLPTALPKGHKVSLNFDLPGGASFRGVRAEVMRMAVLQKNGREDFEHHLKFTGLETAQQESIIRYVFEKQRLGAKDPAAPSLA